MPVTVAEIAAEAYSAVAAEVTDAINDSVLTKEVQGAYDVATGQYTITTTTYPCRSVANTSSAIPDMFPDYIAGPSDALLFIEGLSVAPVENDLLDGRVIREVGDIVEAGTFFAVIVRGD